MIGVLMFVFLSLSQAWAQPTDQELARALEQCMPHKNLFPSGRPGGVPWVWEPGWEHCAQIEAEIARRKTANAEYTKSIADQLKK